MSRSDLGGVGGRAVALRRPHGDPCPPTGWSEHPEPSPARAAHRGGPLHGAGTV